VREPGAEEDGVVAAVRLPREQVGMDEAQALVAAHALRSDREHLRRGVETAR
jgi:hypothetical protein